MSTSYLEERGEPAWQALLLSQVRSLRFGVVQVVVHDSRVIQIERTEKLRLDRPASAAPVVGATALPASESAIL